MPCGGGLDEGVGGSLKVLFPWRGRRRQSTLAMMAARLPPVESTATEQTDILELTHEEQEVDATGESVDTGEKISLSDID